MASISEGKTKSSAAGDELKEFGLGQEAGNQDEIRGGAAAGKEFFGVFLVVAFEAADDEQGEVELELVVGVEEVVQAFGGVHAAGGEHQILPGVEAEFFGEEGLGDFGIGVDAVGDEFDGGLGCGPGHRRPWRGRRW